MKKELENEIAVIIDQYVDRVTMNEIMMRIEIVLEEYDVQKQSTELIVWEGEKNDLIVKRFLAAKIAAGLSRRTIQYYKNSITTSLTKIGKNYDEISADDIRTYIAKRIFRDGVSKTSANNERRNLSAFYTWLQKEEILLRNPMNKVDVVKETKKRKEAFTQLDVEMMRTKFRSQREKAIFEVLLSTWCRVSELINIKLEDINGYNVLVHGKGDKDRAVYLNARAKVALEQYLAERKDNNPYLFPKCAIAGNFKGRADAMWYTDPALVDGTDPMDSGTAETIIRALGKRAGVQKAHPHRLRRTGATWALRSGMPILQVSKTLGHESIATTQIYLDVTDEELMEAHRKFVT